MARFDLHRVWILSCWARKLIRHRPKFRLSSHLTTTVTQSGYRQVPHIPDAAGRLALTRVIAPARQL
jgi:hypothetical protein